MKFKVGDVCQIREWDDMKREFGTVGESFLCVDEGFPTSMRGLCGSKFVVASARQGGSRHGSGIYTSANGVGAGWSISGDMLKYYGEIESPEDEEIIADPEQFASFLDEIFTDF